MPTPFPPNKTIKELGIDTTRTFVVTKDCGYLLHGDKVVLEHDDGTDSAIFCRLHQDGTRSHLTRSIYLSRLAYADDEPRKEYVPKVGDIVEISYKIRVTSTKEQYFTGWILDNNGNRTDIVLGKTDVDSNHIKIKLLSRKPRRVTLAEVREKFGEEVEIIEE